MRARLIAVLVVPLAALLVVLGVAYARSLSDAGHQQLYLDRLADANLFVATARQAFAAGDPQLVDRELDRYRDVYGIEAAVLDNTGGIWATNGLRVDDLGVPRQRVVDAALSGRSDSTLDEMSPWSSGELLVAEPVFDSGDLLGAVVTSSSSRQLAEQHRRQLSVLLLGGLAALVVSVLLASRLAHWVLRPVRMVDAAMTEIWHGHVGARIADASGPPELRRVVTAFNGMSEKVEQLIYKQQEFVSNASHELRNPLNALLLRIEDLHLSLGDTAAAEVDHVREEGRRMARILDALLMLARDQGASSAVAPVELGALARGRLDAWRPVARDAGVAVALDARAEVWCEVDDIVVESALDAVVDNALKFAPPGSVVEVRVEAVGDRARIAVRDHGPGLAPEEIEHVTDRFWRSPQHQNARGAGLGLAIATEFLDSCGGRLEVAAADGGGLVVTLWVPIEAAPA